MIERPGSASQPHHAVADEAAIAFEKHFKADFRVKILEIPKTY